MSHGLIVRATCLALLSATASVRPMAAQQTASERQPFAALRTDGNGIVALAATTEEALAAVPAATALKLLATHARLNITFDPTLAGLGTIVVLAPRRRTVAEALIEIANAAKLRVAVSLAGQLVVFDPASMPPGVSIAADTVPFARGVPTLPAVHAVAVRPEREGFDTRADVGRLNLAGKELRKAPRFFSEADLLRSVQLMPGVQARNDYSATLNVRGGEADQNLILLDGYPIYNPFHLGGLFGTFIDPTIGEIDLLTGGFPSNYGGRLSSVLDVRSAGEGRRGVHGTGEVSLIASTASLSGAMGDSVATKGSWMLAARRTYADRVVDLFDKGGLPYHFRDAQLHVTRDLGRGFQASLTAYDGQDALDAATGTGDESSVHFGNRVLGATVQRGFGSVFGDSLVVEQRASLSTFRANGVVLDGALALTSSVRDLRVGGSVSTVSTTRTRRLGYEIATQRFGYAITQPVPLIPVGKLAQATQSRSLYYDETWRVNRSLILAYGARADAVRESNWIGIQPRLSVRWLIRDNAAVTAGVGEYSQWVRSLAREDIPFRALDYWQGASAAYPVSRAWHYLLGYERWVNPARFLRVEGFYKAYRDLLEPNLEDDELVSGDEFRRVRGASYGFDVLLRQYEQDRFSGWLAYTFGISRRSSADAGPFFPSQDRRHNVNLVGSWRFSRYTLGLRLNVASGTPYTRLIGEYGRVEYDASEHAFGHSGETQFLAGARNAERLPIAQRIDLSVTRNARGRLSFSPYLSIANVYNAKNVFMYLYDYAKTPPERIGLPQFPIFPTLGMSIAW